jgi:CBS domain-containing protein
MLPSWSCRDVESHPTGHEATNEKRSATMTLVREVMTSPAVTIHEQDESVRALTLLDRHSISSLPVVDDEGHLLGAVGEGDVIRQISSEAHPEHGATCVRDLMRSNVQTVRADDDLALALALIGGAGVRSLPVLLHDRVIGMLSSQDIIRAMSRGDLRSEPARPGANPPEPC